MLINSWKSLFSTRENACWSVIIHLIKYLVNHLNSNFILFTIGLNTVYMFVCKYMYFIISTFVFTLKMSLHSRKSRIDRIIFVNRVDNIAYYQFHQSFIIFVNN